SRARCTWKITLSSATSVVSLPCARPANGMSNAAASRSPRIRPPGGGGDGRQGPYGKMPTPDSGGEGGACPPRGRARIIAAAVHSRSPMRRAVLLCCFPLTLAAQQPAPAWAAYVKTFDAYVAAESIVGASTWLIRDGKVVARHEVGWADRAAGQRVDDNTIY